MHAHTTTAVNNSNKTKHKECTEEETTLDELNEKEIYPRAKLVDSGQQ